MGREGSDYDSLDLGDYGGVVVCLALVRAEAMTPMPLERALEVAIRQCQGGMARHGNECPHCQAAAVLRAFMEKGLPFYRAAENHCDLWERDYRNANDPAAITKRLWDAREAMFLAYRAMGEGK